MDFLLLLAATAISISIVRAIKHRYGWSVRTRATLSKYLSFSLAYSAGGAQKCCAIKLLGLYTCSGK